MLVNNRQNRILYFNSSLFLMPGVNRLTAEQWAQVKASAQMADAIEDGELVVVAEKPPRDTAPETGEPSGEAEAEAEEPSEQSVEAEALVSLNAVDAIKLVKDTADVELLQLWLEGETRVTVKAAITAQIEKLEADV